MKDYEQFLDNPDDVLEFKHPWGVFKKDNKSRSALNATLETDYKAVYRKEGQKPWVAGNIDWDGETFFILTRRGRILSHTNSEWGGIGVAKPW